MSKLVCLRGKEPIQQIWYVMKQHIESPGAEIVFNQHHGHSIDEKSGRDIFKTAARTTRTRARRDDRAKGTVFVAKYFGNKQGKKVLLQQTGEGLRRRLSHFDGHIHPAWRRQFPLSLAPSLERLPLVFLTSSLLCGVYFPIIRLHTYYPLW